MSGVESLPVQHSDIERASERLENDRVVERISIERSTSLGDLVGVDAYLKMEHLQWMGSFKTRGAYNKIRQDTDRGIDEFVAASVGNHTQGVAPTATECGADSTVVMPKNAPQTKVDATRDYGAEVEFVGKDFQETMAHAQSLVEESDARFAHAYDDYDIVARQGTLGAETCYDLPEMDTVVVPIGGDGFISGITTAIKHHDPEIRVIGAQVEGAETVRESLGKDVPVTLDDTNTTVDGTATDGIPELMLRTIKEYVDEAVTASDGEIAEAIFLSLGHVKQAAEGAGAVSIATVLSDDFDVEGETVMPLLCGGGLDITMLQTVLIHALTSRRQTLRLRVRTRNEPGEVARFSRPIVDRDANIHDVRHVHAVDALDVGEAHLLFRIETKGTKHAAAVVDAIEDVGYAVDDISEPSWRPVPWSRLFSQPNPECLSI